MKTAPPLTFLDTGENKFAAMMDILEEMDARSGIKPNAESWGYVLKELVQAGDFRLGWVCIAGMKSLGITPDQALVDVCPCGMWGETIGWSLGKRSQRRQSQGCWN